MKIRMKPKTGDNWVEYEDVKFLIDYLTSEQEEEIQRMALKASLLNEADKKVMLYEIARYYLKCCIKGWEIPGVDFKSENGKVEPELFYNVIGYDVERVMALYNDFAERLSFTETDKKK